MGQITIYLEDTLEAKVRLRATQQGISVSKRIAAAIEAADQEAWPAHVIASFGTWDDVPDLHELPLSFPPDTPRVSLDQQRSPSTPTRSSTWSEEKAP